MYQGILGQLHAPSFVGIICGVSLVWKNLVGLHILLTSSFQRICKDHLAINASSFLGPPSFLYQASDSLNAISLAVLAFICDPKIIFYANNTL